MSHKYVVQKRFINKKMVKNIVLKRNIFGIIVLFAFMIGFAPIFVAAELQRATISDPRLENAFGDEIVDNVNVYQQIQISSDITNNQKKSQTFVYLVQIKNEHDIAISLSWFSGQLSPEQKLSPSLSWTPDKEGTYVAEIYAWDGFIHHNALAEQTTLQINVS